MIILGIETSCDETAAAVLEGSPSTSSGSTSRIQILSNVVASSASLQSKYGGIIPEQAAREQIKSIIPVIEEVLSQAFFKKRLPRPAIGGARNDGVGVDAVAVTYGPGLIGSLLVGVETAKTLARIWNKPLIPVNHLLGHFYANWITGYTPDVYAQVSPKSHIGSENEVPKFPCIGLLVSGGHTDLVLFTDHGKYEYLGGTRDDAAGECFDKCARLLGLPYPGGPEINKLAEKGKDTFRLPRPMINSNDLDFSFSGLKTAVANLLHTNSTPGVKSKLNPSRHTGSVPPSEVELRNLCASIETAIIDVLVVKTVKAAQKYNVEQIIIAGGVASNQKLVSDLEFRIKDLELRIKLHVPPPELCTDNGAMIAAAGFFLPPRKANKNSIKDPLTLQANPNLSLAY